MTQASANVNVMIKAARKAGRSLVRDFTEVEQLQVSLKGPGNFVSRADLKAEEIVRAELMEARPNYGWVGEESAPVPGTDPTRRWIVDPLDGTTNYLHGLPHWSVSIALEHKREIVAGVIYDPVKDEIFVAEKGAGAWMNDRRLRVSGRSDMMEMVFGVSMPAVGSPAVPRMLRDMATLAPRTAGVRRFGSAALDLAYVAAGRLDGYWGRSVQAWDIAAGIVIVREAGGFAGAIDDEGNPVEDGSIVAGNPAGHAALRSVLREA